MTMESLDKLVRVPQALEMLGISRSTLFRLEKSGALAPRVRIGRRSVAYRLSSLVAFLDNCAPVGVVGRKEPVQVTPSRTVEAA